MDDVRDVLSRLKYIASFRVGDKIDVNAHTSYHKGGLIRNIVTGLMRTLTGASRHDTYAYIEETLLRALTLLKAAAYSNSDTVQLFIADLLEAKKGVESQIETYKEDDKLVADYKTLMQTTYSEVSSIQKRLTQKS